MGPLITLFWTSGVPCPEFQGQDGSFTCVLHHLCNRFLRFTSDAAPADLLIVSMAAEPFHPYTCTCITALAQCSTNALPSEPCRLGYDSIFLSNAPFANCRIHIHQLAEQFLEEIKEKHQFARSYNEIHPGKDLLLSHVILEIVNSIIWERNGCFLWWLSLLRDIITFDSLLPVPNNYIIAQFIIFGNRQEDCL